MSPDRSNLTFKVPKVVAVRATAARVREQAISEGATVLDFSGTEYISHSAADELVCKHQWDATTGEDPDVREAIVHVLRRRGKLPVNRNL